LPSSLPIASSFGLATDSKGLASSGPPSCQVDRTPGHFESLEDLLAAALQDFSERRIARYRAALAGIAALTPLVETMTRLYEEDARSGQLGAEPRAIPTTTRPRGELGIHALAQ
jgi:hypothetical protein